MKINWKDYVYYETEKELNDELNSVAVAFFKNNRWQIYLGFQSPDSMKTFKDIEKLIDETMSETNVKRENIKLVVPPSYIECEEISAEKYIKKMELQKIKRAEKKLKEQQKRLSNLKKAAKTK